MPRAKKFHTWAFNQLVEYIEYKAEAVGIDVTQVPPQYTSQRCSKCGHTARNNRPTQADFSCQNRGYEVHADYNAAKNVGFNAEKLTGIDSGSADRPTRRYYSSRSGYWGGAVPCLLTTAGSPSSDSERTS